MKKEPAPHRVLSLPDTPLLLRPKQAAKALAISERTLWSLTRRRELKPVRIGRAVAYSVTELLEFIRRQEDASPISAGGKGGAK
ncbi:MAG TPA: helix-turn-helix domain-containing protein [Tepidisphaeraceae bacterium]|jgi:excisionase family DNA binding protein